MSRFQFRLQSVLKLRERDRDKAAQAVQQAELAKQKLVDQIHEIENERSALGQERTTGSIGAIDIQRLLDTERYDSTLIERVLGLQSNVSLIEDEIHRRRAKLVECEKGVRVLEKLAEQQKANWTDDQAKRQQDVLDEWASFRHFRNKDA